MATLVNNGNINWDGSWQTTSKVDALHASTNLICDSGLPRYSGYWTGNAANTDFGCLAYLHSITTPATTRTITVTLESALDTAFTDTLVTEQTSTFITSAATKTATWIFFNLGSVEAEDGGTPLYYRYKFITDTTQDTLFRTDSAGTTKVAIVQVLNATASLAATDVTYIVGLANGATADPATATVTMNVNDSVNSYGACYIGYAGVLSWGVTAATVYNLILAGNLVVYNGGTYSQGTTGAPMPSSSSGTLTFDMASSGQYGITVSTGGTANFQGTAPTYEWDELATSIAASDQSFVTTNSTGWAVGNEVVVPHSTITDGNLTEIVTITGISGTTIYIDSNGDGTGGTPNFAYAHTAGVRLGCMTRNVRVTSDNVSYYLANVTVVGTWDIDNAEFRYGPSFTIDDRTVVYSPNFNAHHFTSNCNTNCILVRPVAASTFTFTYVILVLAGGAGTGCINCDTGGTNAMTTIEHGLLCVRTNGQNIGYCWVSCTDVVFSESSASSGIFMACFISKLDDCDLWSQTYNNGAFNACTLLESNNCKFDAMYRVFYNSKVYRMTNANFGSRVANSRFAYLYGEQIINLYNCANVPTSTVDLSVVNTPYEVRMTGIHSNEHNQVAGRYNNWYKYGFVCDQITGGQIAAWARGGSGICIYLDPSSTTNGLDWEFYIPVTASTAFTPKFYHKITASFNGSASVTIYDSDDDSTILLNAEAVSFTDDGDWHQYTATSKTPTATGFCRVVVKALDGATTGDIGIDDVTVE